MAALPETATKADDAITLVDTSTVDGFTDGDPQAGVAPTQLSAKLFNAVVAEIANAIRGIDSAAPRPTLDPNDWGQLAEAIHNRLISDYPKISGGWIKEWRTEYHTAPASLWKHKMVTDHKIAAAKNTAHKLCSITVPDDGLSLFEFKLVFVNTGDITDRAVYHISGSCHRTGGAVTVHSSNNIYTNDTSGVTVAATSDAGSNVALTVTTPALPDTTYNIFSSVTLSSVTL